MREQIHHETVTPAEWLFCSDGLLPCFRDNETGIRNGPAFFQQARRAPLHGSPLQPACQTAGSPTGRPPRHPQQRSPASQQPPATGGAAPTSRLPRDRSRNGGQTGTAATRRAAVPCALLHKPAGPPRPAVPLHNPPGHQRAPPFPSGKSAYQFPRLAPLRMPDRYIRSVAGPPGARRFAAEGGGRAAENIFFLIPEYHLTTA